MNSGIQICATFCVLLIAVTGFSAVPSIPAYAAEQLADNDDHGNEAANATPIDLDTSFEGIIAAPGDVDWFSFDVNLGDDVTISAAGEGSALSSLLTLFEKNGVTVLDSASGTLRFLFEESGRYFIEVKDSQNRGGGDFFYTLTLILESKDDHGNNTETATAIELDTPVDGVINVAGDEDWFSFYANKEDNLIIATTGEGSSLLSYLTLLDIDGNIILESKSPDRNANAGLSFSPSESGEYFIRVRHDGFRSSDQFYTLILYYDDHSSNTETATPVELNTTVHGRINVEGNVDYFSFETEAGDEIVITVTSDSSSILLTLFDTDGVTSLSQVTELNSSGTLRQNIKFTVSESGKYFIQIRDKSIYRSGNSYALSLTLHEDDHGNNPEYATPISLNTPTNGVIGFADDVDCFSFEANQGDAIRIETTGDGSALNVVLVLLASDGSTILKRSDSSHRYKPTRFEPAESFLFPVAASGQYFIMIKDKDSKLGGDHYFYTLKLTIYEDDYADSSEYATPIDFDTPISGVIGLTGDVDYFSFEANQGKIVNIEAIGQGGAFENVLDNVFVSLLDTDGVQRLAGNQDFTGFEPIIFTIPKNGIYFVQVRDIHNGGGEDYLYTLMLTLTEVADDHGSIPETATYIEWNTSVEGRIEVAGDMDYFGFEANRGEHILVDAETISGWGYPVMSLLSTDGITVIKDSEWSIQYTFSENGRYFIRIRNKYTDTRDEHLLYTLIMMRDDHSENWQHATPITLNTTVDGLIDLPFDEDYFNFDVNSGDTVKIDAETEAGTHHRRLDLFDTDGITRISPWTSYKTQPFVFTFTKAGKYFIEVRVGEDNTAPSYTLTLSLYEDEHGNHPDAATPIDIGTSIESIIGIWGDVDCFSFDVNGGDELIITMSTGTPSFRGEARILDTDGITLLRRFAASDSHGNDIFQFPESGRYFVEVSDSMHLGGDDFFYTLSIALYEDGHGDSAETATPLRETTSIKAVLNAAGDSDWFSYDGESGDSIAFILTEEDSYHGTKLTLFDTDGITRVTEFRSYTNDRVVLPFTIPESGRYFLRAAHESFLFRINLKFQSDLGNYSVSEELRQEFGNNGFPLSQNVNVSVDSSDQQVTAWRIRDSGDKKTYLVRKDSADVLNVYDNSLFRISASEPLFYTLDFTVYADDYGNTLKTATPIELNTSIDGVIDAPGDADFFHFDARKGDRVIFDITEKASALRVSWYLFDADGIMLENASYGYYHNGPLVFTISEDGQYFVEVRDQWYNNDGIYEDNFYTLKAILYADDHGDDPEYATLINANTAMDGVIGHWADEDWFSFDVDSGKHMTFALGGNMNDRQMTLFATDGITILNDFRGKSFTFTFPESGRYFIRIRGFYSDGYGSAYTLTAYKDDHGNNAESATPVELNIPVNGLIQPEGDQDWFAFNVQGGETIRVATIGEDSTFNASLTLFNTDGLTRLQEKVSYDSRVGIAFTASESGQYFVQVEDYDARSGNDYFYILEITPYKDDHGNAPENSTPINFGTPVEGIIGVSEDGDWFSFDADSEKYIIITVTGEGSAIRSALTLTDGIKTLDSDSSRDSNISLIFIPPVSGRYYAQVRDSLSGRGGDDFFYTLELTSHEDDHGDDPEHATPIDLNTPTNGIIARDVDCFSFEAVSGDLITIDVSSDISMPLLALIGTDGETRISGEGRWFSKAIDYQILEDGTYYVDVTAYDDRLISYTLTVSKHDSSDNLTRSIDVNDDGTIDISDLILVGRHFGETGDGIIGDTNNDGIVDIHDMVLVGNHLGESIGEN